MKLARILLLSLALAAEAAWGTLVLLDWVAETSMDRALRASR